MALEMHPSLAVHAGEWIRTELMEPHAIGVQQVADHFGVSRQTISAIVNGRSGLTAEMAIRFESAFGIMADTLLRMQAAYEMAQARAHEADLRVGSLIPA